jgi:hypothetical protein
MLLYWQQLEYTYLVDTVQRCTFFINLELQEMCNAKTGFFFGCRLFFLRNRQEGLCGPARLLFGAYQGLYYVGSKATAGCSKLIS